MNASDRGRRPFRTWLAATLLAWCGCAGDSGATLQSLEPPSDWQDTIVAARRAKDEFFRSAPDTPLLPEARPGFAGLDYWAPDARYYLVGTLVPYAQPERRSMITTAGKERPAEKVGWVGFRVDGRLQTLQVFRLLDAETRAGSPGFFLPFTDGTTGHETYPSGRYVELLGPTGGPYVLDFNRAYNPSCAYGDPERFACPVTPPENRLDVRIEAGERGYARESGEDG